MGACLNQIYRAENNECSRAHKYEAALLSYIDLGKKQEKQE